MITKLCSKCKVEKHLSEFENRPDSKDGKRAYCRTCKLKQTKDAYSKRLSLNEMVFWNTRSSYLNCGSGRRNGKAATKIDNSSKISAESIKSLYEQSPYCAYCKINLNKEEVVFDHKNPLCRDGSHTIENLCVCCKDCNQLKSFRTQDEFLVFLKDYLTRFMRIPC